MKDIFYQSISPTQETFDMKADDKGRPRVVFNVDIVKNPSERLAEELITILVAAGVGVFNTDIFASSAASIPDGDGPYLSVIETGGSPPIWTHNSNLPSNHRPGAKIITRASTFVAARAMAWAAFNALVIIRNETVTIA